MKRISYGIPVSFAASCKLNTTTSKTWICCGRLDKDSAPIRDAAIKWDYSCDFTFEKTLEFTLVNIQLFGIFEGKVEADSDEELRPRHSPL
jgi:hypothetical protein